MYEFVACAFYYICFHLFIDFFLIPFFPHQFKNPGNIHAQRFQTDKNVNMVPNFFLFLSLSPTHTHSGRVVLPAGVNRGGSAACARTGTPADT